MLLLLLGLFLCPVKAESPLLSVRSGDLPLLIVAGHGGKLVLPGAAVRDPDKINDPHFVLYGDAHTNELASELTSALALKVGDGRRPSLILNLAHRRYADVNRTPELTSHDSVGVAHHAAFHQAIDQELERLVAAHGWALLLDLHGQAHYQTTLLLGTGNRSELTPWSVEALWGEQGMVAGLKNAGYTVEPTSPDGQQRYGGGYTIRHHGEKPSVEAWQMEHSRAIRDSEEARSQYLQSLADALARTLKNPPPYAAQTRK
jgi:N-formylglutamate amidohydrolase